MACGCNNSGNGYGWGGCGCNNTVQYAPSACNPNFPTTCTALGTGVIQRVVGENSAYCKYTVPTLASNSLLTYNASTGLVNWNDGSTSNPIYLGSNYGQILSAGNFVIGAGYSIVSLGTTNWNSIGVPVGVTPVVGTNFVATGVGSGSGTATQISTNQTSQSTVGSIQGTTPTGQLVAFTPNTSTETQFPVVSPSGTTTTWGTIENIIPNQGVVYKTSGSPGIVAQASLGTSGQVLTINTSGVPQFLNSTTPAFIDAQAINLYYASNTTINVSFGSLVFNSFNSSNPPTVVNGNASTYTLAINTFGPGAMDTAANETVASTYYYVYAIYDQTNKLFNVVGSPNSTQPATTNLGTYTYYRLIGVFYTGASNSISSGYYQNGRTVYFGNSNWPQVFTTGTDTTHVYFSNTVANFPPTSIANKVKLVFVGYKQAATQAATVDITNVNPTATSPTTTNYYVPVGSELYGSAVYPYTSSFTTTSPIVVYNNFESDIPKTGTIYAILNLGAVNPSGAYFTVYISGCNLTIF